MNIFIQQTNPPSTIGKIIKTMINLCVNHKLNISIKS